MSLLRKVFVGVGFLLYAIRPYTDRQTGRERHRETGRQTEKEIDELRKPQHFRLIFRYSDVFEMP